MLKFKTKTDTNGNTYAIEINTETKTIYNATSFGYSDFFEVGSRKKLRELEEMFLADGFTRAIRLH